MVALADEWEDLSLVHAQYESHLSNLAFETFKTPSTAIERQRP
jgi:hypothetical protein